MTDVLKAHDNFLPKISKVAVDPRNLHDVSFLLLFSKSRPRQGDALLAPLHASDCSSGFLSATALCCNCKTVVVVVVATSSRTAAG
jgi:hypothetical protein